MQYQKFASSGFKDIGIQKFGFVAKTQFLLTGELESTMRNIHGMAWFKFQSGLSLFLGKALLLDIAGPQASKQIKYNFYQIKFFPRNYKVKISFTLKISFNVF